MSFLTLAEVFRKVSFLHLSPGLQWDEEEQAGFDAVFGSGDAGVAHAVATLVTVECSLAGFQVGDHTLPPSLM